MRLKKIVLFGFKSFADRTSLEFHPGITAIVGPNGCGKSNIADAFRWVLGEQSAKSLRGHKMQDVIFAGTTNRRPLHIAEVSVTLADVQGALPIEFDEVSITRRLHRSGESEYLLNNSPVRLKDLQALFFDSGIGKEAFSIFEQGKIDQVIHYTPLERRTIFEEAAGIVRFLHRKREALKKLEQTDLNLTRIEDVLHEVQQRIAILEKQAERALQYKEQKIQLEMLEKQLLVTKWKTGKVRVLNQSQIEAGLASKIDAQTAELKNLKDQHHQARVAVHEFEQSWKARNAEMYAKRNERDLFQKDRSHIAQRREELQQQIIRWEEERQTLARKGDESSFVYEEQAEILGEMRAALAELKQKLDDAQRCYDERAQELEELRLQQEDQQKQRLALIQTHSAKMAEWKQSQARGEALQERLPPLGEKAELLKQQKDECQKKLLSRSEEMKKLSDEIDGHKNRLGILEDQLNEIKETLAAGQASYDKLVQDGVSIKARLKILQELKESMEGLSESCRRLLKESEDPHSPIYNKLKPLYEVIIPPSGLEKPATILMQPYAQTLVTATDDDRQKVLAFAKTHRLADFSLFCAEDTQNTLQEHFFGGLTVVKTLKEALKAAASAWTEGMLVDGSKVLFYETKNEGSAFAREAEIIALQDALAQTENKKAQESLTNQQNQQRLAEIQLKRTSVDKEMRTTEMKLVEVNYSLLRYQGDFKRIDEEHAALLSEKSRVQEAIETLALQVKNLEKETSELDKKLKNSEQASHRQQTHLEELSLIVKNSQNLFEATRRQWQEAYAKERQQQHQLELITLKKQEAAQRIKKIQQEISQAQDSLGVLHESSAGSGEELSKLQQQVEKLESSCAAIEKNLAEAKQRMLALEENIQNKDLELKNSEAEKNKLTLQLSQQATMQEALSQAYQEKYNEELTDARAATVPLLDDIHAAEKQLRQLKQNLDTAEDVNMMAIDECANDKQRSSFLGTQVNDLKATKSELSKIIMELDTQSRKLFKETFNAIRANFQKNFSILFNGGEADLHFVEGEDVLEAGIEISAKPPGKQMRSISLLSGGEKCLTAMALLFAIFEVKPAPYCILDEIDAPLDDTNVKRFLDVVENFTDTCQFIIITHNKRTMAIADRLFGVSMQERGVSKLLTMEFAQELAMAQ